MLTTTATTNAPVRTVIDGSPVWLMRNGRVLPVIRGGDGPDDPPELDDEPLRPEGVKALEAWKARAHAAEAAARRIPELEAALEAANEHIAAHPAALDAARIAAAEETTTALRGELGAAHATQLFNAELRASAAGRLVPAAINDLAVDSTVALRLLGLDSVPVTETGDINREAISLAVGSYLDARPHLALSATQQPGSIDQGHRPPPQPPTLADRITAAEQEGKWGEAMSLKTQQLAVLAVQQ